MVRSPSRKPPPPDAYAAVRLLLLGGEVQPGKRLSHRGLAKGLGLSRSPVREALLQLEAEGLIEHRPQSGGYLREVSLREIEKLHDMREVPDPYAAARAAKLADPEQIERMRRCSEEFAAIAGRRDLTRWLDIPENRWRLSDIDCESHATILAASGNSVALRFFENAQILAMVVSWNFMKTESATLAARTRPTATHHRGIFESIHKRDAAGAARRMKEHVRGMKKRILEAERTKPG